MTAVAQDGTVILSNEYDVGDRVITQNLTGGRSYTFHYFLDSGGRVVGVDVRDSAGLTWKISMSGGAQYTMQPVRNRQPTSENPSYAMPLKK